MLFFPEPLEVEMNPVSKKRLVGEDVTFCCHVTGEPPPKNYEWSDYNVLVIPTVLFKFVILLYFCNMFKNIHQ